VYRSESSARADKMRDNLDPTSVHTDQVLHDVLRLVHPGRDDIPEKYRLDADVADEGANFSAGEKQLRQC
jgi:ATP-binding cassette subfamily C (CFTR/MRP) protein 1